jgi:hypothetical protein
MDVQERRRIATRVFYTSMEAEMRDHDFMDFLELCARLQEIKEEYVRVSLEGDALTGLDLIRKGLFLIEERKVEEAFDR